MAQPNNTALKVLPLQRDQGAIDYARGLLRRCEAGDVVAVTAVEELRGGTYSIQGSATPSRTQTAGMLLDAAIARLTRDE